MIYDNFRVTGKGESIWDFSDLMEVALRKENVQGFDTKKGRSSSIPRTVLGTQPDHDRSDAAHARASEQRSTEPPHVQP